jgi:uncharacterized phiE125 gp8 family phage protein
MIEASRLIEGPVAEPVSRDEAKDFIRVTYSDDDLLIDSLIKAAREHVEMITGRALMPQTWALYLTGFPDGLPLELPLAPFKEISAIKYWDQTGTEVTANPTLYETNPRGDLYNFGLAYMKSWPALEAGRMLPVTVEYEVGYEDADSVPSGLKIGILELVSHWYNVREPIVIGTNAMEIPLTVERLLWPYRLLRF